MIQCRGLCPPAYAALHWRPAVWRCLTRPPLELAYHSTNTAVRPPALAAMHCRPAVRKCLTRPLELRLAYHSTNTAASSAPPRPITSTSSSSAPRSSSASKKQQREDAELAAAQRITWIGAGVNLGAAGAKAAAGIAASSPALVADAAHSLSDLLSDGVALWATKAARRPQSRHAPYGSGKFEALGAVACSVMIAVAGVSVGIHSLSCLPPALLPYLPPEAFSWFPFDLLGYPMPDAAAAAAPPPAGAWYGLSQAQWWAAAAAAAGVVCKEILYRETLRVGTEVRSSTLLANAWHHRTDAFSSVVAGVGLVGGALGTPLLDPIAGLVVAFMVTKVGVGEPCMPRTQP